MQEYNKLPYVAVFDFFLILKIGRTPPAGFHKFWLIQNNYMEGSKLDSNRKRLNQNLIQTVKGLCIKNRKLVVTFNALSMEIPIRNCSPCVLKRRTFINCSCQHFLSRGPNKQIKIYK